MLRIRWQRRRIRRSRASVTAETPRELFGRLGGVVSQACEPGDIRSESVLYAHARKHSLERNADTLIAREEWHRLS